MRFVLIALSLLRLCPIILFTTPVHNTCSILFFIRSVVIVSKWNRDAFRCG
ncbi:MAG: hypothetical protein ICV60_18730 [Pyrinomonadaceae bacterium]|nr:hypothetical protein [Pyrinomonadaceae bacterium]